MDLFESDEDENESDSNSDISDPEDESKPVKPISNKKFQRKLKNTNSMFISHSNQFQI